MNRVCETAVLQTETQGQWICLCYKQNASTDMADGDECEWIPFLRDRILAIVSMDSWWKYPHGIGWYHAGAVPASAVIYNLHGPIY